MNWVEILQISTMILLHVFILIAIIATIMITFSIRGLKKKIDEILDKADDVMGSVDDAVQNIGDAGGSIAEFISPFIPIRRASKLQKWVKKLLK